MRGVLFSKSNVKVKFIQRWPTIRATFKCRAMNSYCNAVAELDALTDLGSIVRFYHYLKRVFSKH